MYRQTQWLNAYPGFRVLLPFGCGLLASHMICDELDSLQSVGNDNQIYVLYSWGIGGLLIGALGMMYVKRSAFQSSLWGIFFSLFLLAAGAFRYLSQVQDCHQTVWPEGKMYCQGIVSDEPLVRGKTVQATCILLAASDTACKRMIKEKIQVTFLRDSSAERVRVGDGLSFYASVTPLNPTANPEEFDYPLYLNNKGFKGQTFLMPGKWQADAQADGTGRLDFGERASIFFMQLRHRILFLLQQEGLQADPLATFSALALGSKRYLTSDLKDVYRQSGTSHILALSGMHLSILLGLFYMLLSHGLKYSRWRWCFLFPVLLLVWGYVFMAGMPVSLRRAAMMYTFSLWGMLSWRKGFTLNLLYWSAFFLLWVDPFCLFDVGFQLSYMALLGILLLQRPLESLWTPAWSPVRSLWSAVTVSVAAQLTTTPLVYFYFHEWSPYGLIATLAVSFLTLLLLYCLPLCLLFAGSPSLLACMVPVISFLVDGQNTVLRFFASLPGASLGPYCPTVMTCLLFFLLLFWGRLPFPKPRLSYLILMLSLAASMGHDFYWMRPRHLRHPLLVMYHDTRQPGIHLILDHDRSYLLSSEVPFDSVRYATWRAPFWKRVLSRPPVSLTRPYSDSCVVYGQGMLFSRLCRIRLLDGNCRYVASGQKQIPFDYYCVSKGFRGELTDYIPDEFTGMVVLDASLYDAVRLRCRDLCQQKGWTYHDIRKSGALKVAFK